MKQLQICHLRIAAGPAAAQPTPKVAVAKPASAAVELEQAAAGQTAAAEQQALEQAKLIGATGEEQQQPGGSDQQAADQGSGAEQSSAGSAEQLTEEQLAASLDPTAEQLQQEAAATASPADEQSAPDELGAQPEEQAAAGAAAAAAVSSVCLGGMCGVELHARVLINGTCHNTPAGFVACCRSCLTVPCTHLRPAGRRSRGRRSPGCVQAARCGKAACTASALLLALLRLLAWAAGWSFPSVLHACAIAFVP